MYTVVPFNDFLAQKNIFKFVFSVYFYISNIIGIYNVLLFYFYAACVKMKMCVMKMS